MLWCFIAALLGSWCDIAGAVDGELAFGQLPGYSFLGMQNFGCSVEARVELACQLIGLGEASIGSLGKVASRNFQVQKFWWRLQVGLR